MILTLAKSVIFATACAFSAAAGAQQYKWTDKDGRVRYGDVPPPGVQATPLRAPSTSTPPTAPAPASKDKDASAPKGPLSPAEQEAAFRRRQQERQAAEEKAAKERSEAKAKRANCEQAKTSLRAFESGQRIAVTNQAGERVFLEDAERAKQMERARQSVKDWCE